MIQARSEKKLLIAMLSGIGVGYMIVLNMQADCIDQGAQGKG